MDKDLITCPYNSSHRILPHRFSAHLTRCAIQYPEMKLEICLFNSNHRIRAEEMAQHKLTCPDRVVFEKMMNPIDVGAPEQEQLPMPKFEENSDDEDWEDDVGTKESFDAAHTSQAGCRK